MAQAPQFLPKLKYPGRNAAPPCPVNGVLSLGRVFAVCLALFCVFFHVKIQLLLQREETVGTRGGLMSVPTY